MTSVSGINRINSATIVGAGSAPRRDAPSPREPKIASSRALIPLAPVASSETPVRVHPDAKFIAHLIATDQRLPQTRERRRADPQDVIAAYAAAMAGPTAPAAIRVFRVM